MSTTVQGHGTRPGAGLPRALPHARAWLGAWCLALALGHAPAAAGQSADELWESGRSAYAASEWAEARTSILAAIQARPSSAEYYLGLARTLFQMRRFDEAVFYYDLYIQHFGPVLPASTPARNSVARAREERQTANQARSNPRAEVPQPEGQAEARAAMLGRIEQGSILTAGGGGAAAMYDALIRSGYARPDLIDLRRRLAEALLQEAELFVPADRAVMPALSMAQWEIQRDRMRRHQALVGEGPTTPADGSTPRDRAQAMRRVAEGQIHALNDNHARALEHFQAATEADPTMLPAWMGRLNAHHQLANADGATRDALLTAFEAQVRAQHPAALGVVTLYRAAFISQSGQRQQAVESLVELLVNDR
jgi:tetratricopeptide (TPR) repeat protein